MLALENAFYSIVPPFKLKWQTARCFFTYRAAAISENNALSVKAQCWRFGWEIVHRAGGNNLHSLCRVVAAACLLLASFKSANDFFLQLDTRRTNKLRAFLPKERANGKRKLFTETIIECGSSSGTFDGALPRASFVPQRRICILLILFVQLFYVNFIYSIEFVSRRDRPFCASEAFRQVCRYGNESIRLLFIFMQALTSI